MSEECICTPPRGCCCFSFCVGDPCDCAKNEVIAALTAALSSLRAELAEKDAELAESKRRLKNFTESMNAIDAELARVKADLEAEKLTNDEAWRKVGVLEEQHKGLVAMVGENDQSRAKAWTEVEAANALIVSLEAAVAGMRATTLRIIDKHIEAYSVDLSPEPTPGQHGKSVDACSFRALRYILPHLREDISEALSLPAAPDEAAKPCVKCYSHTIDLGECPHNKAPAPSPVSEVEALKLAERFVNAIVYGKSYLLAGESVLDLGNKFKAALSRLRGESAENGGKKL